MTLTMIDQSIQFIAWLIAILELIFGLYMLVLNAWHYTNRHVSGLYIVVGVNTFAVGWMIGAFNPVQAQLPALLLAMTTPAIQPLLFVAMIAVVKPEWLLGRKRWIWWLFYLFTLIPVALTLYDHFTVNPNWFSGLPSDYTGGFISLAQFTQGLISDYIRLAAFTLLPALTILLLIYFAILDKHILGSNRRLAWLLLIAEVTSYLIARIFSPLLIPAMAAITPSTLFMTVFGYAILLQIISERRVQRGSLQARLTASIMVVSMPLLIAVTAFVNWRADALIKWAAITQRPESELLAGAISFQTVSIISLAIGVLLLFLISWLTMRHVVRPIEDLTNTATGVASGDFTRVATIQSEDELGALARAFNSMITQVRESITNLERRVVERNRGIERRAIQLKLCAEVARQSASISDLEQLMNWIVRLISDRFNFYHTGIFLVDDDSDHVVLRAASSPGGRRMLERNHKLAIDQTTLVGYVAEKGDLLISQDGDNPNLIPHYVDLPQTRSEMALPLRARERLVGVLDLHSNKGSAFPNQDIEILQILSNQIALAIDHAKLHAKNEDLSNQIGSMYQQHTYQSWQGRLEQKGLTYAYRSGNVRKELSPVVIEQSEKQSHHLLELPIVLRDHTLGWITLRRHHEAQPWSEDEINLVKETLMQIALALENARFLEENQQRAKNEALVGHITGKTQGLLDVESVMKTAVREIGRSLGLTRVQISLSSTEPTTTASQSIPESQEQ